MSVKKISPTAALVTFFFFSLAVVFFFHNILATTATSSRSVCAVVCIGQEFSFQIQRGSVQKAFLLSPV